MRKLSSSLYKATRAIGKVASAVNDLEHLGKSLKTGDASHIVNRMTRKSVNSVSHSGAEKIAKTINKWFK